MANEELIALSNRIAELEERLALYEINGLADSFSGSGNQTYGRGDMRLGKHGAEIVNQSASELAAVYVLPAFSSNPGSETYRVDIGGRAVNTAAFQQSSAHIAALAGDATLYNTLQSYVSFFTDTLANTSQAILSSQYSLTAGQVAQVGCYSTSGADSARVIIIGKFYLTPRTTDPAGLSDSDIWSRSDLFRLRLQMNGITGNIGMEIQSATAPAVANNGTITTAGVSCARVAPAGAVTGVILAVGTTGGQVCTVVNESVAASTVTFAASGTSNVADGVSSIIAGLNARTFVWDAGTSLWYPVK